MRKETKMSDKKISKPFTALTKDELLDVIEAYDLYVWTAFDANLPHTGWAPCGVQEFYQDEYQNVWITRDDEDENPFGYMYDHED